ncbi:hypothetical protein NIES4071_106080 (plasmid) [Calothrix sp. NIES-4071]|nr:hypothetical protein NIES4071_106080 [Calothrix sp. NIES-4071]BAZ65026.1 hypothetical protein NIES4105_107590 [Calothrix sp. NIES-4105]
METLTDWTSIYFDGAAEPTNPGTAAGAAILDLPNGESITVTVDIGVQTNNAAEYSGAIAGLEKALELGCRRIKLFGDSQLVIYQLIGKYRCHSDNLKPFCSRGQELLKEFDEYEAEWIPRAQNSRADAAAGEVLRAKLPPSLAVEVPCNLPVMKPRIGLQKRIEDLQLKGKKASFKEWLSLKSGRDEFSLLKGVALEQRVPDVVKDAIIEALRPTEKEDEKFIATVYRWYLRGLPANLTLHKCRIDAEFTANMRLNSEK